MSLVPYALRPRYVLRSFVVRKGLVHPNPLVRPLAMLMVGQGDFLRVKAIRHGLILGNPYWRAVGAMLLAREVSRRALKSPPERLARERFGPGHFVKVTASAPELHLSRRQRRAELKRLESEALASVASRRPS
ncbi:MAG: hypothetical protein WBL31_15630 [Ilumatobacteraceae bacterium]|jgi:argonaute-like protein implicated in RNA metabolism and viral defense